jgi:outer membrane protein assembly factor BamB
MRRRDFFVSLLPASLSAIAAALVGAVAVIVWLSPVSLPDVTARIPSPEARPEAVVPLIGPAQVNLGTLIRGPGTPSQDGGNWPQFRGIDRTNVAKGVSGLARSWPAGTPRTLWKLKVGEGHAGAAIHKGCVYLMDYDHERQEDAIRRLALDDGSEIWRYTYYVKVKRNHGMSRTVPAVDGDYVVTLGPMCHVHCLEAATGRLVWKMDLVKEFGAVVPLWYAGQCPLLDGDRVILAPGADPLMMAVELSTGQILWKTPNPGGWAMTHSSIVPVDYKGNRQYVYCTTQGVVGVAARDGKLLWTKPDWKIALATVPSPLPVGDDMIFLSGGYNSGCALIRLKGEGENIQTQEVFRLPHTVFGADQHTPILHKGYIYGMIPTGELACLDLAGNRLWSSGMSHRFGLGPFLIADDLIFALNDQEGRLHMVEASPSGYKELAQAKVLDGYDAWGPMAMVGNRLILRDANTMVCLELPRSP